MSMFLALFVWTVACMFQNYVHTSWLNFSSDDILPNSGLNPPENVSASIALALLARELHSAPRTTAFLVSGYPRHVDDLDHYLEKVRE